MTKYRIVQVYKFNYYNHFQAQKLVLFLFWTNIGKPLDTLEKAKYWLQGYREKECRVVVYEE